ncbi:type II toxin-antitoxin system VapC family toxin [Candidatus Parcubacteria bacterium]|nr:MAG: type II toxin-antitoxin system VapC family toxin [Candidatus Parcubacteria bacterium]
MNESKDSAWPSYLIDSDVLIDHLRGYRQALDFLNSLFQDGAEVYFSVISEAEIYSNVRPGEISAVRALFSSLTRLDVSGEIARKAGEYRAQYLPSHSLALPDALIAATAFVVGADLITRNVRHYPMADVRVVEPYVLAER